MRGITMELRGWSDNFDKFYTDVLKTLSSTQMDDTKRFNRVISNMKISYENAYQGKLFN